jgi:hypothetical protein
VLTALSPYLAEGRTADEQKRKKIVAVQMLTGMQVVLTVLTPLARTGPRPPVVSQRRDSILV